MKLLKFRKFLEEVELNLDELGKLLGDKKRGDILIKKIKNKEELTTNNNKEVKVDKMKSNGNWVEPEIAIDNISTDNEYDLDKGKAYFKSGNRYIPVFMDEDGDEFKLNQFKKTKDFGSGGAGVLTTKFESVQCIFLGIKQSFPDINLNSRNLLKFYKKFIQVQNLVFVPERIKINEDLIKDFLQDSNWVDTFCRIPNKIWSSNLIDKNQLYLIYHASYVGSDSPYVNIDKKYKQFAKSGGWNEINISKYCPADVYLIAKLHVDEINTKINNCDDINSLTDLINNLFKSKLLIPISLKKVKDSFKIITNSEPDKDSPNFFIRSFHIGSDMKGIGSKISTTSIWKHRNDKDVDIKDRKINFDSSNTSNNINVDGEIEGSSSRHGKISFTSIKRIIDDKIASGYKIQNLQSHSELKKLTIEQLKSQVMTLINNCIVLQKSIGGDLIQVSSIKRGTDISNSENRLISRIQSMQIVLAILQLHLINHKDSNEVITKIMRYALSIETDKFKTPMYLRII